MGTDADSQSDRTSSYKQILRSSAIVGGSSAINVAIGLVRTKAMAVLLGPSGIGLMAALTSIADLTRTVAEMGINSSGVRQIADSAATRDTRRVATTVSVLRRTAVFLGLLGMIGLMLFAAPVSRFTFNDNAHNLAVFIVAGAVLFRLVADGQAALLQGFRNVGALARINVWSALLGTTVSLPLIYYFRDEGIAPALVAVAAITLFVSWWFSRRVRFDKSALLAVEFRAELRELLRLGLAFMLSGFATMAAAYIVKLILIRSEGLVAAGLYQSAWAIGGVYVAFVLHAMGTDFYPRLVGVANDDDECNRLVNEQALVSVLLASVGVVATLTLAPWVLHLLYSASFSAAADSLRWVCLGMAMRVVTWPLGYILVVKGKTRLFVGVDVVWSIANVGLTVICVRVFGVTGAGLAFFLSYVLHLMIVYPLCRRLTGFRWTRRAGRAAMVFAALVVPVQISALLLGPAIGGVVGGVVLLVTTAWSIANLGQLVAADRVPPRIARLFAFRKRT